MASLYETLILSSVTVPMENLTGESVQDILKIENAIGPAADIGGNSFEVYLVYFHFMAQQLKQADVHF